MAWPVLSALSLLAYEGAAPESGSRNMATVVTLSAPAAEPCLDAWLVIRLKGWITEIVLETFISGASGT